MTRRPVFPIPIDVIPIARTQRQDQLLGDRQVTLDIGWTTADDIGRVVVTTSFQRLSRVFSAKLL